MLAAYSSVTSRLTHVGMLLWFLLEQSYLTVPLVLRHDWQMHDSSSPHEYSDAISECILGLKSQTSFVDTQQYLLG
jgi:hypothetical protein